MRRKPGTDTEFPAQFAGNWLSVPGFARGICCPVRFAPKTVKHQSKRRPERWQLEAAQSETNLQRRMVSETTRKDHPDIPWYEIAGMRNRLIHEYFGVDLAVVWKTVTEDLEILLERFDAKA